MTKELNDITYFISFCIEQYKMKQNLSGGEVFSLFDKYGVTDFLIQNYSILHSQSHQWIIEEIDGFINNRRLAC